MLFFNDVVKEKNGVDIVHEYLSPISCTLFLLYTLYACIISKTNWTWGYTRVISSYVCILFSGTWFFVYRAMNPKVMHACYGFFNIKNAPNKGQLRSNPSEPNHLKKLWCVSNMCQYDQFHINVNILVGLPVAR